MRDRLSGYNSYYLTEEEAREKISYFSIGDLFRINEEIVFYNLSLGEFGNIKTPQIIESEEYIIYLEKIELPGEKIRLIFFHHKFEKVCHDIRFNDIFANKRISGDLLEKIILVPTER